MQKELICILTILGFAGCNVRHTDSKEVPPIGVRTQIVRCVDEATVSRYVGVVESIHETPLSLQVAGRVLAVNCKNGTRVHKGQMLLRVDNTQAMNALRSAEASLRYAEDGYNRLKQVHEAGAVTDQKMVEAENQLAQARSLRDMARRQVKECEIMAPCAGVVSGLDIAVGQTIVPGMRLLSILDLTAYQVRFTVPEADVGSLNIGQKGEMECAAVQHSYPITITDKGLTANKLAHTYEIIARIDGGEEELRPGMVSKVMLSVNGQQITANCPCEMVIPANCVLLMPQGASVWLAHSNQAERLMVTIGGYRADGVLVTEGLHEGDTLIIDGYQKLYQGCKIVIE